MCQSQTNSSAVKVLTICELLENRSHHADIPVAVIGRHEQSVGIIDHYEFLAQDGCDFQNHCAKTCLAQPDDDMALVRSGYAEAPSEIPKLSLTALAEKLALVLRTSELGFHKEPRPKKRGGISEVDVPNDWVVAYARIMSAPDLARDQCGEYGCRGFPAHR